MAIDPKAAAAAAQAAAEAARAAAEAAAAAAAQAESDAGLKEPTLADSGARQVLEDTEATGAGDGQLDGTNVSSILDRDADLLGGSEREGFASLPGLESVVSGARNTGVESPFDLESSFDSNQSPGFGTDMISTVFRVNIEKDKAELVKVRQPVDNSVPGDTSGDTGGTKEANPLPPGVKPSSGTTTTGGSTTGGSTTGGESGSGAAGGGAGGDMPAEDATFVPPPGWVDFDDLDFVPDDRKVGPAVAGATGQDPSGDGDDDSRPGPQGGDWAVNPGSENMMTDADRNTDLRNVSAVTWVGQPAEGDEDLPEEMPAELQALEPGPGPEVINPDRGDADTADSGAQASTAYRTAAGSAGSTPASDAGPDEPPTNGASDAAPFDPAGSSADDPTDLGAGMPPFDPDAGAAGDLVDGRGRDFGQKHGQGHGQGNEHSELDE